MATLWLVVCRKNDIPVRIPKWQPSLIFAGVCYGQKTGTITKKCDTAKHVMNLSACDFALDLSLISFHSFAIGFAILCSQSSIFAHLSKSEGIFLFKLYNYVNEQDFELPWLWEQVYFDCICWLVPVTTINLLLLKLLHWLSLGGQHLGTGISCYSVFLALLKIGMSPLLRIRVSGSVTPLTWGRITKFCWFDGSTHLKNIPKQTRKERTYLPLLAWYLMTHWRSQRG